MRLILMMTLFLFSSKLFARCADYLTEQKNYLVLFQEKVQIDLASLKSLQDEIYDNIEGLNLHHHVKVETLEKVTNYNSPFIQISYSSSHLDEASTINIEKFNRYLESAFRERIKYIAEYKSVSEYGWIEKRILRDEHFQYMYKRYGSIYQPMSSELATKHGIYALGQEVQIDELPKSLFTLQNHKTTNLEHQRHPFRLLTTHKSGRDLNKEFSNESVILVFPPKIFDFHEWSIASVYDFGKDGTSSLNSMHTGFTLDTMFNNLSKDSPINIALTKGEIPEEALIEIWVHPDQYNTVKNVLLKNGYSLEDLKKIKVITEFPQGLQ